jgi:2-polyprenyl-6-methoxyphenol hydroxylase-like FAD-dependent oxidoreductase
MIPIGGFGMNTGVLDAYDLGWKLVATLNGWGGEKLLASYTVRQLPLLRRGLHEVSSEGKVISIFHSKCENI